MQDFLNVITGSLFLNMDAFGLSLATGIATMLVLALKALFAFARRLARKTPTEADDKIVDETEAAFREKSKDI
ncbi:MAG: hypothetical protein V1721_07875 [Pseudomonadota bacterium]